MPAILRAFLILVTFAYNCRHDVGLQNVDAKLKENTPHLL